MSQLDYQTPTVRSARVPLPRRHVIVISTVLVLVCGVAWFGLLAVARFVVIDSHYTKTPQTHAAFSLSPWRTVVDPRAGSLHVREATMPLALYTLRYKQVMSDADGYVDTTEFDADIRWFAATITFLGIASLVVLILLVFAHVVRPKRE